MVNSIHEAFADYANSKSRFEKFHNQIINMPRDEFSSISLQKIQSLASYLLLLQNNFPDSGLNYKEILGQIIVQLKMGNFPEKNRYPDYEKRYFTLTGNIDELYEVEGRMFRHLMGLCAFWGLIRSISKFKKVINFELCTELAISPDDILIPLMRNNLLNINIKNNDFILSLHGINVIKDADYRPAFGVIKYLFAIKRPCTQFELAALLGRIDEKFQTEPEIVERALSVGRLFPQNQDEQIKMFFGSMGWKNSSNKLFQYAPSQEPYFKFKTLLLFMNHFDLINIEPGVETVNLTEYSITLLESEIPPDLADLEDLLSKIDDDNESDALLSDLIIRKRSDEINRAIHRDESLIQKINLRSLRKVVYDVKGKKKRNQLVAEIAKIKADYTCQATGKKTFKIPSGNYYVEAHHLIEFSTENGPDITENLIILGPEKHHLLHKAVQDEIDDLYNHLKTNGVIDIQRFKRMHKIYNCLTEQHIKILFNKKIISSYDRDDLLELLRA